MLRKIPFLIRRPAQFLSLIWSAKYYGTENTRELVNERYSHPSELSYYEQIALNGLDELEAPRVDKVINEHCKNFNSSLVVGAGTGREVIYFKDLFTQSFGIDTCSVMIDSAIKISKENNLGLDQSYQKIDHINQLRFKDLDFIYLTVTLMNHIKGRANRIEFYKNLKSAKNSEGIICGFSNILPLSIRSHFYWISLILRIKSFFKGDSWERGDSLRSYLGSHTSLNLPIFYHFDQSQEHILDELSEAGLKGEFIFAIFWVAK